MRWLKERTGANSELYIRVQESRIAVEAVRGLHNLGTFVEIGAPLPLHVGAGGKVLLAWLPDDSGFYYTRMLPRREAVRTPDDLKHRHVYFHKLGTPIVQDTYAMGKDLPRIAEIDLRTKKDGGRYVLATVANGDGGEFAHYVLGPSGNWTQVTRFEDQVAGGAFGVDDTLYLLSRKGTPRGKIMRLPTMRSHNLEHKSSKKKRKFTHEVGLAPSDVKTLKQLLRIK